MFSDAEIRACYHRDLHAHDVSVLHCWLAERQGVDLHVISRAEEQEKDQPMLPWDEEDKWMFEEDMFSQSQ